MNTKSIVLLVLLMLACRILSAVSAYPGLVEITQPDGTKLNIYLKGDERTKWAMTEDGYTLLRNKAGVYEYAAMDEKGDMVISGIKARNISQRDLKEKSMLDKTNKSLFFSDSQLSVIRQINQIYAQENANAKAFPTTGSRKLICILIGYQDKPFVKTNADFNALFNTVGYNLDGASGSVKDFYLENSYGQLDLQVDVAGPYVASQNMAYYGANDQYDNDMRPRELVAEAIDLANPDVDFRNYDNDQNGAVDGVYVIYAGYGEEYSGVSTDAIWAHAWYLISTKTCDGVTLSRYSCSSELRGNSGTNLCRIGVICHEFGHVLGSPDFYDTNYDTSGQYQGTGYWDLMASGSWNNSGATPAHFTGLVKVRFFNWATETVLSVSGTITLYNAESDKYSFYRLNTTTTGEYFFIENREKQLFDTYIPGSGMIIYHVHSLMGSSSINITHPQKMYPVSQNATMEPNSESASYGTINSSTCPWTGTGKSEFSDTSTPSSRSWAGANTGMPIKQIFRNATAKTVTFNIGVVPVPPLAPVANSATIISQTTFSANWSSSAGAIGYYLDVSSSSTFASFVSGYQNLSVGNVNTYPVIGLSAGTTYYYRLRAVNDVGPSGNSNTVSLTTLPNPPAPPTANAATNVTSSGFTATWSASSGATGYYLDVSANSGFTSFVTGYNNKSVGNVTSSAVTGLSASTTYYYRVRAYNTGGTSGNSNPITVTTAGAPPATPVATAATGITNNSFIANWVKSTGATKYFIDVSTSSKFSPNLSGYNNKELGDVALCAVTGLSARKTYYYRVRAGNSSGTSSNSNVIKVTTLATKSAEIASSSSSGENVRFLAWPNPFTDKITINYYLPEERAVSIDLFDSKGQLVKSLVNGMQPTGDYQYIWDTGNGYGMLNRGLYLLRFRSGEQTEQIKMICR
jgi:M6 family metalloprotease-like protein